MPTLTIGTVAPAAGGEALLLALLALLAVGQSLLGRRPGPGCRGGPAGCLNSRRPWCRPWCPSGRQSKPTNGAAWPVPLLMGSSEATSGMLPAWRRMTCGPIFWSGTTMAMPLTFWPTSVLIALMARLESVPRSAADDLDVAELGGLGLGAVGLVDEVLLVALLLQVGDGDRAALGAGAATAAAGRGLGLSGGAAGYGHCGYRGRPHEHDHATRLHNPHAIPPLRKCPLNDWMRRPDLDPGHLVGVGSGGPFAGQRLPLSCTECQTRNPPLSIFLHN